MANPVYDISPADVLAVNWFECRLVMEINDQYFLYTVLDEHRAVVALKYYAFSINESYPLREQLYEIVKSDEVLHRNMKEFFVIYNMAENSLVPESVYQPEFGSQLLDFLHGDLKKGLTLSEKLGDERLYNVFRVPGEIHEFFTTGFPSAKFAHYFSLWLKCLQQDATASDKISLVFYPKNLLIAVTTAGKPQFLQTLPYQTPEDVAYYLLNIFDRYHFNQEETTVSVGGMVDIDSAVFEELLKYFENIETASFPAAVRIPESLQAIPEHFFSPLLNLALCVS